MTTHRPKQTKDGVNYVTEKEFCERLDFPLDNPEIILGPGWPEPDLRADGGEDGLLYREDDIEEFLARPDIGRPDRWADGRPFTCGSFEEDGPRLFYWKDSFEDQEKKRAGKTQPEEFLGLIDEVMQLSAQMMRPYYPESDELSVALLLTIWDDFQINGIPLHETGSEEGWRRSHLPWCETFKDTDLDIVHLRTKARLEIDRWMHADPMVARWVAIREADDLLDRTMAAALHHCSDDPAHDSVALHVWVGTPRMPRSTGMSRSRTVRGWTRRNGISTNA